jgi:hypothetical protein
MQDKLNTSLFLNEYQVYLAFFQTGVRLTLTLTFWPMSKDFSASAGCHADIRFVVYVVIIAHIVECDHPFALDCRSSLTEYTTGYDTADESP